LSVLGGGRLGLGEVGFYGGSGKEEESTEDDLGDKGAAEKHPGGSIIGMSAPEGLDESGQGFGVERIGGPAQGVGEEVEDDGGSEGAEEDFTWIGVFEIAGKKDHGSEANERDEKLGAPAVSLHGAGEWIGKEPDEGGKDDAADSEKGHATKEEGTERREIAEAFGIERPEDPGNSKNDNKNNQRECALHER